MHMSFEKITPTADPAPEHPAPEHPAARAAKLIRGYHAETLTMIEGGFIFTKEGVDCNAELRAACQEHIVKCDAIIERAANFDPSLHDAATAILAEAQDIQRGPTT